MIKKTGFYSYQLVYVYSNTCRMMLNCFTHMFAGPVLLVSPDHCNRTTNLDQNRHTNTDPLSLSLSHYITSLYLSLSLSHYTTSLSLSLSDDLTGPSARHRKSLRQTGGTLIQSTRCARAPSSHPSHLE